MNDSINATSGARAAFGSLFFSILPGRRVRLACFLLSSFCLFTLLTMAVANGETYAPEALEDPAYRKLIKEGLSEYDARHFEEARSLFQRAHELNPNARTYRGIGMASFELRDYVAAVHNLGAALKDQRKPLSTEQRKHVQDLLDRSRMFVDVYSLVVSPKNARVLIDGRVPEYDSEGIVILGFGQHVLEASLQGYVMRTIPINVRGGERKELIVTLEKVGAFSASTTPPASMGAKPVGNVDEMNRSQGGGLFESPAVPYFIAAGGALVVGLGAGALLLRSISELDECNKNTPPPSYPRDAICSNKVELKTYRNLSLGATAVGVAAAGTFFVLGILKSGEAGEESKDKGLAMCAPTLLGISCAGSF